MRPGDQLEVEPGEVDKAGGPDHRADHQLQEQVPQSQKRIVLTSDGRFGGMYFLGKNRVRVRAGLR